MQQQVGRPLVGPRQTIRGGEGVRAFGPGVAAAARFIAGRRWMRVFGLGLALWLISLAVTKWTGDSIVIASDVMLGAFLVPVTLAAWTFDRREGSELTGQRIVYALIVGGSLSMLATVPFEQWLVRGPTGPLLVGLIEEASKLLVVAAASLGLHRYTLRDGIVLGAVVGCGFSAFESSGYALNSLSTPSAFTDTPLGSLIQTEAIRSLMAPFTHGLWTAIGGGVLFSAAARGWRLQRLPAVIGTYLLIAHLHAYWDSGTALTRVVLLAMRHRGVNLVRLMSFTPVSAHVERAIAFDSVWTAVVAASTAVAIGVLIILWRHGGPVPRPSL